MSSLSIPVPLRDRERWQKRRLWTASEWRRPWLRQTLRSNPSGRLTWCPQCSGLQTLCTAPTVGCPPKMKWGRNVVMTFYKMGHSRPLFLYFRIFKITVDNKQTIYTKICRWLDLNYQSLVLEATAMPTEPQPLHQSWRLLPINFHKTYQVEWKPWSDGGKGRGLMLERSWVRTPAPDKIGIIFHIYLL